MPARYLIGIDLGTTNSAVAYVDTHAADSRVRVFEVQQLDAPDEVAPRRRLPSFGLQGDEVVAHWEPRDEPGIGPRP